jgi:oxygen-independent coproporphyrinogen-3 oxidase
LSPLQLEKIINTLIKINPNILRTADEISIEATPESIELEKFSMYKKLGINRVSMGLQTLVDSEIKLCNRTNFSQISIKAIEILKEIEIPNIVLDLMIGIEGQNIKSFKNSVKSLIEYKPETIELYAVGLMPNTALENKKNKLMSNKEIYQCYNIARKLFLKSGYVQDCHNRYILEGKGSFYQEDYLFSGLSLIGFGAGSRTYAKNIHYRNNYYPNSHQKAIIEYIKDINNNILPIKSATYLNSEENMHQYTIYNIESLDKKEFKKNFGSSFKDKFPELYYELLELKLAKEDWRRIWLTAKGLNYRDLICKQLFSNEVSKVEEEYRPK